VKERSDGDRAHLFDPQTDPAKAAAGTIRKTHARSIGENSVHGSDAPETAVREIAQFFSENEIVG
jgi:nucleoside-diphosphate kinase